VPTRTSAPVFQKGMTEMATQPKKSSRPPDRPEELVGATTGRTQINGTTFAGKQLTYSEIDDLAVFEGDIVLGLASAMPNADRDADIAYAVIVSATSARWPDATVPYEIDAAMPNQIRVTDAIAHWTANTPIKFVLRTAANAGTFPNYVRFFQGNGCFSSVGMVGGRQDISLGPGCTTGNAIHEIGHTVGLWHEQSREDRDSFVTINWANIDPSMTHNFDQHIADGDDVGPYDYGSIMHYPATAFSTNGQPTIVPVQPGVSIGQRNGLSAGDIAAVRQMYPGAIGPVVVKKLRDDNQGGFKKVVDDNSPVKKLRDDNINVKKLRDDNVNVKKLQDDNSPVKKLRDDNIVGPIKKIRDDNIVVGPKIPRLPGPGPVIGGFDVSELLPFILATPHHADAAAAYEASYGLDAGDYSGDDVMSQLVAAAQAATTAAEALTAAAAALMSLLGDGQGA
jgi:hypothetical protein